MNGRIWIVEGAVLGALGVALAAYGAHGLEGLLKRIVVAPQVTASQSPRDASPVKESDKEAEITKRLDWFETAVRMHFYHAFALLLLGVLATGQPSPWLRVSGASFTVGILLFSGSLFIMTFRGAGGFGAVVPVGGLALILGWLAMAIGECLKLWQCRQKNRAA